MTFRKWFSGEKTGANGRKFDYIVFYPPWDMRYESGRVERWKSVPQGVVLTWEQAQPALDIPFSDEFGSQDCLNFQAWSPTEVFFVDEYDGSTSLSAVDRHPPTRDSASLVGSYEAP